ncbi:hypothetical protein NDA01_26795 [Trichocoleus desertorum AS-A10]|uniref:hypothetical protein n=1 Tax=Trichocoleus desertorum TaxID=1481672 RepID=UPI003298F9EF
MKSFRELKLIGSDSEQRRLITLIEQRLSNGWTRERERENQLNSRTGYEYIIFVCSETASRRAAGLSFVADENGYLGVSNIVPRDVGELSKDQYNAILEEFLTQFVEPAAQGLDIEIRTTSSERTIDNSMSPEMAQLLKRFSAAANKSSGGTHPLDERRFLDFIVQAHREGALLDEAQMSGLLIEDGWSSEHAQELSSKYRFGRDLLSHYGE